MEPLDNLNNLGAQTYRFEVMGEGAASLRMYVDDRRSTAFLPIEWWKNDLDYEKFSMPEEDRVTMREWIEQEKNKPF